MDFPEKPKPHFYSVPTIEMNTQKDNSIWKKDMAELTGIRFAGMK